MILRSRFLPFLAYVILFTGAVCAITADLQAEAYTYIAPQTLPPQLLPPPPEEGTESWRREIDGVLAAQKNISATDLAALRDEQYMRLELMTSVIGPDFTAQRFPKCFDLINRAMRDSGAITEADKQFWHTRRPYLADSHVQLLVKPLDKSPAYPSGHTSGTRVLAEILGLLYPQKLDALRSRAAAIAWHRVEAGVHYPVDVRGGDELAMLIVGALLNNADFQSDLDAAREEIAASK